MSKAWSTINPRNREAGFSVVELLLAATVFGMIVIAVIGAIVYGRSSTASGGDRVRAVALADEAIDAVRNIRDAGFANLVDGTYGLVQSGNQWVLSGSSDTSGIYTRQVTVATAGTSRKNITATVSWVNGSVSRQAQLASMLSDWRSTIVPPATWNNATQASTLALGGLGTTRRVATQGNYAYAVTTSGTTNFYAVGISNTSAPQIVDSLAVSASPYNITVSGNYAYIVTTNNNAEMQIIDISNPANISIVGTFNAAGTADGYGVRVAGDYVYMSRLTNGGTNEVQVVNITNKASPQLAGAYGLAQNMRDICVLGNYAYVITDSDTQELIVLNVTNPASPTVARTVDLTGTVNPLAIRCFGSEVYVAHGTVVRALNVASPTNPVVAGSLTSTGSGTINDISADETNKLLFLATSYASGEFQVVNAATQSSMSVIRTVNTASTLNGVSFNPMLNVTVGASASTTQEFLIFKPN